MQTAESAIFVVDTNVWCAARSVDDIGSDCHVRSLDFLNGLRNSGARIAIDDAHLILREYFRQLSRQFDPYLVLTELMAQGRLLQKHIAAVDGIAILPNEIEPIVQDEDDRKFVAVSLAFAPAPRPPIVNATDSDWVQCEHGLREHGVEVIQLCPGLSSRSRGAAQDEASSP